MMAATRARSSPPRTVDSFADPRFPSSPLLSIYELPECITELVHLTSLNLDANEIHRLPIGMGNLHLKLLKVNRVQMLMAVSQEQLMQMLRILIRFI